MLYHDDDLTEEDRRRLSLPSIKAQHVAGHQPGEGFAAHSRTYPPAGSRQATGGLYPPGVDRGTTSANTSQSGHTPNTSISSLPHSAGTTATSVFSQGAMTESPKPLSPADPSGINRQRSPSLQQQLQQQQFSRRQSDRNTPPGLSLSSPHAASHGPKLPALSGFAAPEARGATHSRGGSGNENNLFASEPAFWSYIQALEEKVKFLGDKVAALEKSESDKETHLSFLTAEVEMLKGRLAGQPKEAPAA
jgi:hypothetical protein